jgi:hypothetical protein
VDVVERLNMSTTPTTTEQAVTRPETYRLPKPGEADRFFGFSRSFYYQLEARGLLKLVRIREEGKERGVTLIPYAAVAAFVHTQMEAQATVKTEPRKETEK